MMRLTMSAGGAFSPRILVGLSIVAAALASQEQQTHISDANCTCYMTNGTTPAFFAQHSFIDFRGLADFYTGTPPLLDKAADAAEAGVTSDFFTQDIWTRAWQPQSWNNSIVSNGDSSETILMQNSLSNIYVDADASAADSETWITLRTGRLPSGFQSAAEMESVLGTYRFVSMRMLARVMGDAGACAGIFTYRRDGGGAAVQEADIEMLTSGPDDVVQYTNQPVVNAQGDVVPAATVNASLPSGLRWTEWTVHRLDWTPGSSAWYVGGGAPIAQITFQAPRDASEMVVNVWSDGGSWSGTMEVGDVAFLQVKWMEMVFNVSEGGFSGHRGWRGLDNVWKRNDDKGGCAAVCSVDETDVIGRPVLLWTSDGRILPSHTRRWMVGATCLFAVFSTVA